MFFTQYNINNCFTLECSFFKKFSDKDLVTNYKKLSLSRYDEEHNCKHFHVEDHLKLGEDLGKTIHRVLVVNGEEI